MGMYTKRSYTDSEHWSLTYVFRIPSKDAKNILRGRSRYDRARKIYLVVGILK
jgi:hypothetical protein